MPGESSGAADGPLLEYLSVLEAFDKRFPGFEHDIHGVERDTNGNYAIECLTPDAVPAPSNGSHPVQRDRPLAARPGVPSLTT
jgi:arginine decarboxylase